MNTKNIQFLTMIAIAILTACTINRVHANEKTQGFGQTISTGGFNSFAIQSDGSLWTWGWMNMYVEEEHIFHLSPVRIMENVVSVSAGPAYAATIKTDGTLWGLGGYWHFVGDNSRTGYREPLKIMDNVIAVSVGDDHTMAIRADNTLWGWGNNCCGELGIGTTTTQNAPVKIMENVIYVFAGEANTMAILKDGSLWAWGFNWGGLLGDGTTVRYRTHPIKIMDNVTAVYAGGVSSMAIRADGSLWVWGSTGDVLGDGITTHRFPVQIMDEVVAVSEGRVILPSAPSPDIGSGASNVAIRVDGSLWAWGGTGLAPPYDISRTPIKIMENVAAVSTTFLNTMVLKNDGSVWTWGNNADGQLGDGTTTDRNVPVKVMEGVMLPARANIEFTDPLPPPIFALPDDSRIAEPSPTTTSPIDCPFYSLEYLTALPTTATVLVNAENIAFQAYNINGRNFFMLRDIAYALNGTSAQFNVTWDGENNAITLFTNQAYQPVGGEMSNTSTGATTATQTTAAIFLNGTELSLTAYRIGDNNFFMLRELGENLGFDVDWDAETSTILISTE